MNRCGVNGCAERVMMDGWHCSRHRVPLDTKQIAEWFKNAKGIVPSKPPPATPPSDLPVFDGDNDIYPIIAEKNTVQFLDKMLYLERRINRLKNRAF